MGYFDWPRCFLIGALQTYMFVGGVSAEKDPLLLHKFVTRPELRAPKWDVTIYDREHVSPGYWFVAPYERIGQTAPGEGWIGPHIYDGTGDLIWSGAHLFGNMSVQDFRVSKVNGKDEMSLIRPELRAGVLLDDHYQISEEIPIEGFNMHDFNFIDDGRHALVILRGVKNSSREDAVSTGLEEGLCSANFHGIAEYDVNDWEHPTWEWSSSGHVGLNESTMAGGPATARCSGEWDYLHANAVDKCPDGDILMSGRHTDAIYKISRATGEIVWRLGGLQNDFAMLDGLNFSRQHDVRCRAQNDTTTVITILDNAKGEDPQKPTSDRSRGLRIAVNNQTMEASLVQHFDHPAGKGGYSYRRGTYQQLPNDNVIIGWSEHALMTEHSPDGKMLMEAVMLPEWVGTYRSYKYEFVGKPIDPPVVHSQAHDNLKNGTFTVIYMSWNGATEVASWKLYKSTENGKGAHQLAVKDRSGFETSMVYDGYAAFVYVEALDATGNVIGQSDVTATIPPLNILTEAVANEQLWQQQVGEATEEQATGDTVATDESAKEQNSDEDATKGGTTEEGATTEDQAAVDDDDAMEIAKIVPQDGRGTAFAAGFFCASLLGLVISLIYYTRRNGFCLPQRLPWHREQVYERISEEEKTASKTATTATVTDF